MASTHNIADKTFVSCSSEHGCVSSTSTEKKKSTASSEDPGIVSVDIFQTHHSLAIKELRLYLETFKQAEGAQSLEGNIEVLASIVFLISLEVSNHL